MDKRLVHGQLLDFRAELYGRLQGQGSSGGNAIQLGRPVGFVDECFHILDLTRDGIGLGIATLAAATLVIVVDRKAGRKEFGKLWSGPEGP